MFYKTVKPLFSKVLMMSLLTFPGRVMRKLRVSRETKLDINFLIFSLKYFQLKLDLVSPLTSFLPLYTFYLISEYGNWNKYCFVPQNLLILNNNTRSVVQREESLGEFSQCWTYIVDYLITLFWSSMTRRNIKSLTHAQIIKIWTKIQLLSFQPTSHSRQDCIHGGGQFH